PPPSLCLATVSQRLPGSAMIWAFAACRAACRVRRVAAHATDLLLTDRLAGLGRGGQARHRGPRAAAGRRRSDLRERGRAAAERGGEPVAAGAAGQRGGGSEHLGEVRTRAAGLDDLPGRAGDRLV